MYVFFIRYQFTIFHQWYPHDLIKFEIWQAITQTTEKKSDKISLKALSESICFLQFHFRYLFIFQSFYIRSTKDGEPNFTCNCKNGSDKTKQGRTKCQHCRYQQCLTAGMCRKGNFAYYTQTNLLLLSKHMWSREGAKHCLPTEYWING